MKEWALTVGVAALAALVSQTTTVGLSSRMQPALPEERKGRSYKR